MVRISKILFHNYRQYRDFTFQFKQQEYNLHIIKAKNGTGKTTFLSGILWCLYNNEYLTNKNKALEIINESVVDESSHNDKKAVEIEITLETEDAFVIIKRTQVFTIKEDFINNIKRAENSGKSELNVKVNYFDPKKNPDELIGDDAAAYIKMYFDESIYKYYFFDGEKLQSYFDEQNSVVIKSSIFNISQIKLLEDAKKHIKAMADEAAREAKLNDIGDRNLYKERDDIQGLYDKLLEANDNIIENLLPNVKEEITKHETQLSGYEPIKAKQIELKELEKNLKQIERDYQKYLDKLNSFIREFIVLLKFYPRIKSTMTLIVKKEEEGSLPPSIDRNQLEKIINEHLTNCPICDGVINEHSKYFINELLNKLEYSVGTATLLKELKVSLESLLSRIEKYPELKNELVEEEKSIKSRRNTTTSSINKCKEFLINNSFTIKDENGNEIVVSDVEKKLESEKKTRDAYIKNTGSNAILLDQYKRQLNDANAAIEKFEREQITKGNLDKKVAVLRNIQQSFELIKENIMNNSRVEIERDTWDIFESMAWKKKTYSKISINSDYDVALYNVHGKEMTGSLSGAETMALAYSFTFAIHKAAGKNCPLVVDSPLGKVSDKYRSNMAEELLKISKNKQIIMLFTPNEYSDEVENVYKDKVNISDIVLDDSESQVEYKGEENE